MTPATATSVFEDARRPEISAVEAGKRLSILYLTAHAGDGGDWVVIKRLSAWLLARGHQVTIGGARVSEAEIPCGAARIELPLNRGAWGLWRSYKILRRSPREFDCVHAHSPIAALVGLSLRSRFKAPVIMTCHLRVKDRGLRKSAKRRLLRRLDLVHCMTEQFARWLSDRYSLDEGKIAVVPNAVCANQFCPPSPSERLALRAAHGLSADQEIVCFIGRLNPEKRVGYLIRFLARHGPDFPQLMLLVGGDGPDGTALRAEAAALNVQSHVRFLGHLRDPRAVYAMSDLCVLPSAEEMFPLVVVEAALTGVPTLRGDSWGHELRQTGESFTSGDEASFQRKLCEMLSSREQLRELGAQARAHSLANLTENATYPRMESLYRRLVKLHRS